MRELYDLFFIFDASIVRLASQKTSCPLIPQGQRDRVRKRRGGQSGRLENANLSRQKVADNTFEKLEENMQIFPALMAQMTPMPIFVSSLNGNLIWVNDVFCSFFSIKYEDAIQTTTKTLGIDIQNNSEIHIKNEKLRQPPVSEAQTVKVNTPSHGIRSIIIQTQVCSFRGDTSYILGSLCDISEYITYNNQSLEKERDRAIATVAAIASHDLNNALTAVKLSLDVIKIRINENKISKEFNDIIHDIELMTERARKLTGRLQAVALTSREREACIDIASEVQRSMIGFGGLVHFYNQLPTTQMVRVDPWRLADTIANLLTNAREATVGAQRHCDLSLTIRSPRSEELPGLASRCLASEIPAVAIDIDDNGVGIAPENLERIFEPGYSTKCSSSLYTPRGFGMVSAKIFAEDSGGKILIRSTLGERTTITLILPTITFDSVAAETREA